MGRMIQEREYIQETKYEIYFEVNPGYGYSFESDSKGNPIREWDIPRIDRFKLTRQDEKGNAITYKGIVSRTQGYWEPAILQCSCGEEVVLEGDSVCEECGQYYNQFGQRLCDPSQWEESY